jgi:hypothetical protein
MECADLRVDACRAISKTQCCLLLRFSTRYVISPYRQCGSQRATSASSSRARQLVARPEETASAGDRGVLRRFVSGLPGMESGTAEKISRPPALTSRRPACEAMRPPNE